MRSRILNQLSIRRKQMLIIMLTSGAALLLACAAFAVFTVIAFRQDVVEESRTLAGILGYNTSAALDFNDTKTADENLAGLKAEPDITAACVFTKSGQLFAKFSHGGDDLAFAPEALQKEFHAFSGGRLIFSAPIVLKGETIGVVSLQSDLGVMYARLADFARIVVVILMISSLIAFVLSRRLQRLITGPILDLERTARSVSEQKDYGVRAVKQADDEVGRLVDGFNGMLAQIQARDAELQAAQVHLEERIEQRTEALRLAQQDAEYERELLHTLLDNSPDHIYFKDKESRFLKVSHAVVGRYGFTRAEEMLGKSDFDLFTEDHARPAFAEEQEIIRTGKPMIGKVERESFKDGKPDSWALTSKMPFRNPAGEIIGTFGISKDITAMKAAELKLFQSQKLETVGKLAGGIAHEFNSIMTAIIGQSELVLNDLPAADPLRRNATEIRKAADRAATLTRQLLAYGRKQIMQPRLLDLNSVLSEMDTVLRHIMGTDVDVRIAPGIGLHQVKADAGQIEQVIINVAMNAADVMPNGGKLTLETANVTLGPEYSARFPELKADDYVMLAITDTGPGMSTEVKARIFEPFFTTKGVGQGTGLGLATCHGIIKQSGGHLEVYSELGRGVTFKIYLPQAELTASAANPPLESASLPRGTERVLLVEDDPALRELAATLLRRLGYTVFTAGNGVEALTLAHQAGTGHIDLLFTDVVMPHMSGKELAERVRALFPDTRILFTSAYSEGAIVHQGALDPGVELLQKPFTPSALAQKVRRVLDAR